MMYAYIVFGLIAIIMIGWVLVSVSLPKDRVVSRTVFIKAPVDKVWEAVTNVSGQIFWRSDLKKVEIKAPEEGRDVWVEVMSSGKSVTLKTISSKYPSLFHVEIVPSRFFKGYWEGEFIKNQSGTTVRIKETSRVDNPLYRPLALLFFNCEAMVDRYQKDLKNHLGC